MSILDVWRRSNRNCRQPHIVTDDELAAMLAAEHAAAVRGWATTAELAYDERITEEAIWAEAGWATGDGWTRITGVEFQYRMAMAYKRLHDALA